VSRLTVLGSGDAFNAGGALHSAYLLEGPETNLLLECGPSVLAGLKRSSLDTSKIDAVLISHLHGDHFGGIPFLFLEYVFANPRTRPLIIAGPPGLEDRVRTVYETMYSEKIFHKIRFEIRYVEVAPEEEHEIAGFQAGSFEVPHTAEPYSLGYSITAADGQSLVFSGDSAWTEDFITKSRGADLFLCECCWIKPAAPIHTSYEEIIAHAHRFECRRILLTHLGEEVRAHSDLQLEVAYDGLTVELGD
jgi:ribonuclease BN (tRNA processing enzyme)